MADSYSLSRPSLIDSRYNGLSEEEAYRQYQRDLQHYDMMKGLIAEQERANDLKEQELRQQEEWRREQKHKEFEKWQEDREREKEEQERQLWKDILRAFIYSEKDDNIRKEYIDRYVTRYHEYPNLSDLTEGRVEYLLEEYEDRQEEQRKENEKWLAEQQAFEARKARRKYELEKCKKPLQYDEEGRIIIDFS